MEASQAGLAGGDAAQGQSEGQQQEGGQDPILQELQSQRQYQEQMFQLLRDQSPQAEPQAEPEAEAPLLDLSAFDDPYADPEQQQQAQAQALQTAFEQAVEKGIAPIREQQAEMRREAQYAAIANEFPELQQPDTVNQVFEVAKQLAEGNDQPHLAVEPWLIRLIYMAGRAVDTANAEGSEGDPTAAHLEGGGGARPTGGQQGDPAEQYRQGLREAARGGRSVLPF